MSLIAIIVSVISASYYIKIIKTLHFSINIDFEVLLLIAERHVLKPDGTLSHEFDDNVNLTFSHTLIISILTLFILLFFLKPSFLLNISQLLTFTLFFY